MSNTQRQPLSGVPEQTGGSARCVPLAQEPISAALADDVVVMLKAIADPTRLRLLSLVLSHEGSEACVCDLLPHFDLSQPTISHHLKVLHEAGLLHREKRGTWVFYIALPEAMSALASLFAVDSSMKAGIENGIENRVAMAGASS